MAASLVAEFTAEGELVYDPFSGCSTVPLEAWVAKRRVIANDLSPYAYALSKAKMFPNSSLDSALTSLKICAFEAREFQAQVDLRNVPRWVRQFFHPETLREILAWVSVLKRRRQWLLLASLLGILHHQRPGFLSFPSSHTVPYLRSKSFPRSRFPQMYEYRSLEDRLEAKVVRAFRRMPTLDFSISRHCYCRDSSVLDLREKVDAIITSPPYMRLLDYGRDNRLRLWFLGVPDWRLLDARVSPRENAFIKLMRRCLAKWRCSLKSNRHCVLVIGDAFSHAFGANLPEILSRIATDEVGGYIKECEFTEKIPNNRRVRRGQMGSASETVLVLRKIG